MGLLSRHLIQAAIGRRLRSAREQMGITQEQLALDAGVHRLTVVRIERGEVFPQTETVLALAAVLPIGASDLLGMGGES